MDMDEADLIATYIERDPHRPGLDRARLKEYGVHVWALVAQLQTILGDAAQSAIVDGRYTGERGPLHELAKDYDVPMDAVLAALAYYKLHHHYIDARITVNTAPDG